MNEEEERPIIGATSGGGPYADDNLHRWIEEYKKWQRKYLSEEKKEVRE